MSDSLVLKGLKDVRKHTGSEMLLMNPKRGGNSYPVKKWWAANANQTIYVGCSVFKVTVGGNECFLAIDTAEMSTIRVDHDGAFGFSFFINKEVSRAALFTDGWQIIEHYVFPKISGGKVMTVIPPGAAAKPGGAPPATTVGTVTVAGDATPVDAATETYTVSNSGNATGLSYAWSVSGDGVASGGTTGTSFDVDVSTGNATVTCVVSSSDAGVTDSPASGSLSLTIT
jgi:hypothetical protein